MFEELPAVLMTVLRKQSVVLVSRDWLVAAALAVLLSLTGSGL